MASARLARSVCRPSRTVARPCSPKKRTIVMMASKQGLDELLAAARKKDKEAFLTAFEELQLSETSNAPRSSADMEAAFQGVWRPLLVLSSRAAGGASPNVQQPTQMPQMDLGRLSFSVLPPVPGDITESFVLARTPAEYTLVHMLDTGVSSAEAGGASSEPMASGKIGLALNGTKKCDQAPGAELRWRQVVLMPVCGSEGQALPESAKVVSEIAKLGGLAQDHCGRVVAPLPMIDAAEGGITIVHHEPDALAYCGWKLAMNYVLERAAEGPPVDVPLPPEAS